jgi:hypothetical protein
MRKRRKLGEMLVEAGLIDRAQLASALGEQKQARGKLGSTLIRMGLVDEKDVSALLQEQLGTECVSLRSMSIPPEVTRTVRKEICEKFGILPVSSRGGTLQVATSDPTDLGALDTLGFIVGKRIKPVLALESEIEDAIARHYRGEFPQGKRYSVDFANLPDSLTLTHSGDSGEAVSGARRAKSGVRLAAAFNALVALLSEKGVITKGELMSKLTEEPGGRETASS